MYSELMVRLSVMYPTKDGSTFDWNYYLGPHLVVARQLLVPRGLVRIEVDRGIGAFPPGTPSHYHAVGHLYFETMLELDVALAATDCRSAQILQWRKCRASQRSCTRLSTGKYGWCVFVLSHPSHGEAVRW